MTDKKPPEEKTEPIAGQYTFFPLQDVLEHPDAQEAQEGISLEELLDKALASARERRTQLFMDMQEILGAEHIAEGGGEPNKKQMLMYFTLLTLDDFLNTETFRNMSLEVLQENPGRSIEDWINYQERDLLSFLFVVARDMFAYKEEHPEQSLFSIWRQGIDDETSEPGKILLAAADKYKANREEIKREFWAEEPGGDSVDLFMEALPNLPTILPTSHVMPNNALMNKLQEQMINYGPFDLPVIPEKKRQKEITAYVMATLDTAHTITSLTEEERDASDAFISIWEQAKKDGQPAVFTIDTLYRAMPGCGEQASEQQAAELERIITRFRHLYIDLDATDELRKRKKIGDRENYHVADYYLTAREHRYTAGGKVVKGWQMTGEPLILSYAKLTGQLLTVPAEIIAIKKIKGGEITTEPLVMSAPRRAMTSYMLRRIAVMKRDNEQAKERLRSWNKQRAKDRTMDEKPLAAFREQSPVILFSSIFEKAGTQNADRQRQRLNRNFCLDVLDFWKAKGYITDYRQQTKGRSITGIEIIL